MSKFISAIMLFIVLFFLFGFLILVFDINDYGLFNTEPKDGFLALTMVLSGITTYVIIALSTKNKE